MRQLSDKVTAPSQNAWGSVHDVTRQRFEIGIEDLNTTRQHYLGFNHQNYTFHKSDIGREIEVLTDGKGWTCWTFNTGRGKR